MASGFAAREILWCSNAHLCLAESQSICSLYICLMRLHFISNVMPHAIHKGSAHQLARTAFDYHLNMPCPRKQAEGSQPWSKANSYNLHYNQLTHWNIVIKCLPSAWQPARCKDTETNNRVWLQGACCLQSLERVEQMTGKQHNWPYMTQWLMSFRETLTWSLCWLRTRLQFLI